MPIPSPRGQEAKDKFFSRCMADKVMNADFPKPGQRYAVCNSSWEHHKKKEAVEE